MNSTALRKSGSGKDIFVTDKLILYLKYLGTICSCCKIKSIF